MKLDALTAPAVASLVALATAVVSLVVLYIKSRRSIVFDAWADFARSDEHGDRGKSFADLLLFHVRDIQSAHQRSARELDLKNPYDDIPAFQQELDTDLKAAVELQRESRFVGPVIGLLMVLLPARPARLRGSIHRFGAELRVNVVLENSRRHRGTGGLQWTASRTTDEEMPALIEELAYEIYLTLAQSTVFSDAVAFRRYTEALSSHLAYGSLNDDAAHASARTHAEDLYKKALDLEPRNPAALYNLGVLHYYMYEDDSNREAERCFRAAMAAAHGALRAQIHSGLANVHCMKFHRFKSGARVDLETAIYHADEALRIDDTLDVVLKAAAFAHHQSSEAYEAEQAAAAEPAVARACAEQAEKHRDLAVKYYRRAIAANPRYYTAHNNFGNFYLELARRCGDPRTRRELLRAAVSLFKETMTIRPAYQHAYDNLGNAYYELGLLGEAYLFEHAARYYKDAFAIAPNYAEARNDLAMLYLTPQWDDCDLDEAQRLHEEALSHAADPRRRQVLREQFEARCLATAPTGDEAGEADAAARRVARDARRWRRRNELLGSVSRGRLRSSAARAIR